ncbi:MAG: CPBP family glutamic-type intramembrane protease [Anaerolineae bacterium]
MAQEEQQDSVIARLGLPQVAPPWGIGETGLALGILLLGTVLIGSGVAISITDDTNNPEPIAFIMGWLIGLVIVFTVIIVRWRRTRERFDALRLQVNQWQPLLALLMGIGGAFTASLVAGLGSGDFIAPMQVLGIDRDNIGALMLVGLLVLLVQPITESLIFAGVTLPRLRASLSSWAGLWGTTLLYALYYYLVFGSRGVDSIALWHGAVYPALIGLTLSAVRVWSQSTLTAMLAHIGVGTSVLVILLLI